MQVTPQLREFLFRYDSHAPLAVETVQTDVGQSLVRERLTFASVNQVRVPANMTYDPNTPAPRPALMIQHGLHSSKDDPRLADLAAAWAPHGFAVLTIDAPLHGERAVGELDLMSLLSQPYTGLRFVVQNVVDLRRAVDLLHERPDIDGDRVAYVGFSMSTFLGVQFVALETRIRAACLALGGAGLFHAISSQSEAGPHDDLEMVASLVDPLHYAGLIAPRPVLQVNSETDQIVPAALGHMLYGALQEPKRAIWYQGEHGEVPDDVLLEMRLFLMDSLESAPSPR